MDKALSSGIFLQDDPQGLPSQPCSLDCNWTPCMAKLAIVNERRTSMHSTL